MTLKNKILIALLVAILIITGIILLFFLKPKLSGLTATETECLDDLFLAQAQNYIPEKFTDLTSVKAWCADCLKNNGVITWSQNLGPFCNLKTADAGKLCQTSSECQGICIAQNTLAKTGRCSALEKVSGCGLVMESGVIEAKCFD